MPGVIPDWMSPASKSLIQKINSDYVKFNENDVQKEIEKLVDESYYINDQQCINVNPATNVLNPRAEKLLSKGMSSRPSLGHPGDKYETGLEAIEQIEIITTALACEVFESEFAEFRVASGSLANLYAFMSTCQPHDVIIAPPSTIGGHITHHLQGAAGLYKLKTIPAPVNADGYTVDVDFDRQYAGVERGLTQQLQHMLKSVIGIVEQDVAFADGVEAVQGDLLDIDALRSVFAGVRTLFLLNAVTGDEFTQAIITLNLARESGIDRVVYLSVFDADRAVNVPHFAVKSGAERMLEAMGFGATILRPTYFIDNEAMVKDVILQHGV